MRPRHKIYVRSQYYNYMGYIEVLNQIKVKLWLRNVAHVSYISLFSISRLSEFCNYKLIENDHQLTIVFMLTLLGITLI